MSSTQFLHLLALLTFLTCSGCASYLAYSRVAVLPQAESVARAFLAKIDSDAPASAHALLTASARAATDPAEFARAVEARSIALTGVRQVDLSAQELHGVSTVSLKGALTYGTGATGEATLALALDEGVWRVAAFDAASPAQEKRLKEEARRSAEAFLEALTGGDYPALARTLAPATVTRVGEARLRALQKSFSHRVEEARFVETRSRAAHPRYELSGSLRLEDGPPHDVHVVAHARRGRFEVTEFTVEPAAGWLAEQRLVARQVAVNFVLALRSGIADDVIAICHPALVKAVGTAKLAELAAQAPQKLAGVTFDDARSTFKHPLYELVGMQQTLAGPQLPARVKVQHTGGRYWVTGFEFD